MIVAIIGWHDIQDDTPIRPACHLWNIQRATYFCPIPPGGRKVV